MDNTGILLVLLIFVIVNTVLTVGLGFVFLETVRVNTEERNLQSRLLVEIGTNVVNLTTGQHTLSKLFVDLVLILQNLTTSMDEFTNALYSDEYGPKLKKMSDMTPTDIDNIMNQFNLTELNESEIEYLKNLFTDIPEDDLDSENE